MIVPRTRLLLWIALIVLPFATVGATVPGAFSISVLFVGGLFVAVLADAFMALGQLTGIRVQLPEVVRIHNESLAARLLRIGFAFPREIVPEFEDRTILLSANAAISRLDWAVTPNRRGQYFLEQAYLEAMSPLGFWAVRTSQAARAELRVYPNLFDERKNVAALFLRRGQMGAHAVRMAGQGRDFEKLREYIPGDSYDEIHWKASAKRGHPVTKVFQIERTQEVYVIVDASRLTAREIILDNARTTALERFVTAALILGLAAEQQGDQFGLITFSDRVLSFVRAKSGQAHYDACRDRLYTLHPQRVTPDFDELCSFIRLRLRKRALLIFLTALEDPMLADMLQPVGANPLFSDTNVANIDDLYRHLGGHLQWSRLRELENVLQRRGVRLSQLDPARLAAQLIAQHAEVKRRQLL
jgi:uncharacterized protein (DUF58 family)